MSISVIFLAGGRGMRMGGELPKQYLSLGSKPVFQYSLEQLSQHPEVAEVIVVCDPLYEKYFSSFPVIFAHPGERRQDSLENGLQKASHTWICSHDAARPFITQRMLSELFAEGRKAQAAALGVPMKSTIKMCSPGRLVASTLDRSLLWEAQTPQLMRKDLLKAGFTAARAQGITVTDDVALAELVGHPVKMVEGTYQNIKITTPEDLALARYYADVCV